MIPEHGPDRLGLRALQANSATFSGGADGFKTFVDAINPAHQTFSIHFAFKTQGDGPLLVMVGCTI